MRTVSLTNTTDILFALSEILDLATPILAKHQQRVAFISWQIASQLPQLTQKQKEGLFVSAMLHDVGALTLERKEEILRSNWEVFSSWEHTELGAYLFSLLSWLSPFAPIIKLHHIKWEKSTLSIDDPFMLEAQIIHLADTVDILIDKDTYILHQDEHIINEILNRKGTSFHPIVVDAFIAASRHEEFWLDTALPTIDQILKKDVYVISEYLSIDGILEVSEFIRRLIDFKTHFTATHSAGVAEASSYLAELCDFSETQIKRMRTAGNLHDIGKLSISNQILEKNEALTRNEFATIRRHTYLTYQSLNTIKGLEDVVEWAAYHHEKLDGSGYPFGLVGHEINLGSRIMAVSDIFTALIEDRPYRSGMSKESVIAILQKEAANNKLDPLIVKILVDNFDDCYQRVHLKQQYEKKQFDDMIREVLVA